MTTTTRISVNPVTGETVQWLTTAEETAGRLSRGLFTVTPNGAVAMEHVHHRSEERFEVLAGTMEVRIDGVTRRLGAGEQATVPAGAAHAWRNAGDDELRFVVEMEPAYSFEESIEVLFGLARDGAVNAQGMPGLLQLAVCAQHFAADVEVLSPPRWVQRLLFGVLAPIGRARGLRPTYPHHTAR